MIIFPAIDIKDGKVVRLLQGKFDKITEYSDDPVEVAKHWESQGAKWLHVVDLDGAETGQLKNFDIIRNIKKEVNINVQVGGGIRSKTIISRLLDLDKVGTVKVDRIILGTSALDDRSLLDWVLERCPTQVGISLDCKNGFIAKRGWTTTSNITGIDLAKELENMGIQWLVYTDIAKDGMLTGPNFEGIQEILDNALIPTVASGGVSSLEDIKRLKGMIGTRNKDGLIGVIIGKALYEKKIDLAEAIKLCSRNG